MDASLLQKGRIVFDPEKISQMGQHIYANNENLRELSDIMDDSKFKSFYDRYFEHKTDIQTVLMLMDAYRNIEKEYQQYAGYSPTKEQTVYILFCLLNNGDIRRDLVANYSHFLKEQQSHVPRLKGSKQSPLLLEADLPTELEAREQKDA